jgi:multiple sugar transport system substrate-binding protein
MHRLKSLRFFPLSLFILFFATAMVLQACGGPSTSGSSSGPVTITVAFEQFGPPPYPETVWWTAVKQRVEAAHPDIKVKLEPIVAAEGDYYTKLDLQMRSASTAPDLVREDSFLVSSDVAAGYLAPLDSYLQSWPEYTQQWFPAMQKITTFNGHNYGVMDGTDDRLIWYNKSVFQKAGLPTTWQPQSWADILSAARTIKAKVPGVIPINLYSGVPMDEASSMQGFEMLLYGTKNPLYDYSTSKWIAPSPGLLDALNFVKQVYNPSNLLGPTNDISLSTTAGNTIEQQLMPQGKVGMDISGSWVSSSWYPGGPAPWPQWQQTMGEAKMPTEFGQAPNYVTLSGGWAYSLTAKSPHPAQAFTVLKAAFSTDLLATYDVAAGQVTPDQAIVNVAAYQNAPLSQFYTSLLSFAQFRPAFVAYPKISLQIDQAMQNVMQGQSPSQAMSTFAQQVTSIAGASNVEAGT